MRKQHVVEQGHEEVLWHVTMPPPAWSWIDSPIRHGWVAYQDGSQVLYWTFRMRGVNQDLEELSHYGRSMVAVNRGDYYVTGAGPDCQAWTTRTGRVLVTLHYPA